MPLFDSQNNDQGTPSNLPVANSPVLPPPPLPSVKIPSPPPRPDYPRVDSYQIPKMMPNMPPVAPSNVPEPEDIFAGTSHGSHLPRTPEALASITESPARGLVRKLVRLLFLAIGSAVVVIAGYFGFNYIMGNSIFKNTDEQPPVNQLDTQNNENINNNIFENNNLNIPEINNNANIPAVIPPPDDNATVPPIMDVKVDTDNDGLSDNDEIGIYQTNILSVDTDSDGLSDRDEVITWKTNPLSSDTDGDGYIDGDEIKNGYNPLGQGKLLPPIVQ